MRYSWIVLGVVLSACGNYQQTNGDPNAANRAESFKTLSFQAMTATIFQPMCYRCHSDAHGNKGNVNLERLANVQAAISDIVGDVQSNDMPKTGPPVPPQLKQALVLWAQAGAPATSTIPMPGENTPAPPPPPPGFDRVSAKIFQPYCIRCHSFLSDEAAVVKSIDKIQGAIASGRMPAHSKKPLSPQLQKLLSNWVAAKMPMGFQEVEQKVFIPYCIRCHSKFTKYNTVALKATDIWAKVMADDMPRNDDPLPDNLKQLLDNWIKQGTPN